MSTPRRLELRLLRALVHSYLGAASIPSNVAAPSESPLLCRDPSLNALVQLGLLRLDADRAFLSLIDGQHQFIAAEATRTHSLVKPESREPDDRLYLGVCKLELSWGICPNSINVFTDETGAFDIREKNITADRSRYVIGDLREDAHHSQSPYVTGFPHMVSYTEVPLISPTGYVIGAYCVIDNKPRDFNNDHVISTLTEVSACIMTHLDLRRMEQNRARSEKLIKGLGVFMGRTGDAEDEERESDKEADHRFDLSTLPPPSTLDLQDQSVALTDGATCPRPEPTTLPSDSTICTQVSGVSSVGLELGTPGPSEKDSHTPLSTPPATTDANPFDDQPSTLTPQKVAEEEEEEAEAAAELERAIEEEPSAKANVPDTLVSAEVRSAFARAATLIKAAMHMDGLTFLDACPTGFASRSRNPTPQERGDPFLSDSTEDGEDETAPAECPTLGCSLSVRVCGHDGCDEINSDHPVGVPDALLHRIIRKYPRGTVFSADQEGVIDERSSPSPPSRTSDAGPKRGHRRSRTHVDIAELFRTIPGARSIIFLPLWHFQSESWFAATIGWTMDPTKAFEKCDLTYLSAFGNSIMAEVSRYEALAVSRSKSDFISSVSHELRSPLHGILASSELLRDSITDRSQLHMLDMIESCGSTLLDTMNHILDFAKINNHLGAPTQGKSGPTSLEPKAPLLTLVDLGTMVQDVVEAVYIGQNSRPTFKNRGFMDGTVSPASEAGSNYMDAQELPVIVTVRVQHDTSWEMDIEVGAWKRIVMNLFGNALKYTRSGHVEVGLHNVLHADKNGVRRDTICFSVNDTGIGMSQDYLKYRLFTPFAQENNLSTGTGLGLSIVKQIVNELGGTLDVQSQIGVGTRIRVFVPIDGVVEFDQQTALQLDENPPLQTPSLSINALLDPQQNLRGKSIYVIDPSNQSPRAELSLEIRNAKHERARTVKNTLDIIAPTWLGMNVMLAGDNVDENADFYFVDFSVIDALSADQLQIIMHSPKWKPLIILCYGPPSNKTRSNLSSRNVVFLRHPLGPKKLAAALLGGLDGIDKIPPTPAAEEPTAQPNLSIPSPGHLPSIDGVASATLPLRSPGLGLTLPMPRPFAVGPPKQHLLLVDDNEINLKVRTKTQPILSISFSRYGANIGNKQILTTLVKKLGCTFETARDGLEAVQCHKSSVRPFDLIFMGTSI